MNNWLKKYLGFYNASLSKATKEGEIVVSKLNGTKTNVTITINLLTLYNVLMSQYLDDVEVSVFLSEDNELLSIASDNKSKLEDLMFQYGGYIDEFGQYDRKFTLQLFDFYKKEEITASI
jgi:hypothetical protein